MNELAVTVIGHDRPGIVADVAEALSGLGANLTDSTMTRLRGHFAMTLVCNGPREQQVVEALRPLTGDGRLLATVRAVEPDGDGPGDGLPHLVTVHGADRLGIVAAVTRVLADAGGNITDLSTRLTGELYVVVAEVDLPAAAVGRISARLAEVATGLGVEVSLRANEADLM